jgi:ParB family chromosome partitioning protein
MADEGQSKRGGALSERLLEDLTAHRTAALRAVLAGQPPTALRALAYVLISRIFFDFTGEACIDIRAHSVDLRTSAEGIVESNAVESLAQRHRALLGRLPEPDNLWAWLVDQTDERVLELLAYCVAVTVNAVRRKGDGHQPAQFDHADILADALGLAMADWWEPTGDRYLNRVPKSQIIAAVSEAVSPQVAESLRPMKKDAMASRAGELLAGKRWLPEALRPAQEPLAETA